MYISCDLFLCAVYAVELHQRHTSRAEAEHHHVAGVPASEDLCAVVVDGGGVTSAVLSEVAPSLCAHL